MKLITLDQRTPEWHAWRANIIGGSDAPAIMGVSPWSTAHKLWLQKTGQAGPKEDNPWMARGREMEDEANAAWQVYTGEVASPCCVEHEEFDFVGASLDGATFDGGLLLEIKCPGEKDHASAVATGQVPAKYWPQVQHQLACVPEAEVLHYWSYRPGHETPGKLIEVRRDPAYIEDMLKKEAAFWQCVKTGTPPSGDAWATAEALYVAATQRLDEAKTEVDDLKKDLLALIPKGNKKWDGSLVSATWTEKAGSVDYKSAFERFVEALLDRSDLPDAIRKEVEVMATKDALDSFRKKGSTYWTLSLK